MWKGKEEELEVSLCDFQTSLSTRHDQELPGEAPETPQRVQQALPQPGLGGFLPSRNCPFPRFSRARSLKKQNVLV